MYPQTDATYAAQLSAAGVGVKSAQYQLDFYTVTAPISGQVETVSVEKDAMAAAGNVAFVISNKNSMTVTFQVAEKVKVQLQVGDAITVERGDETFGGTIIEVGTMAGAQTKLFQHPKRPFPGAATSCQWRIRKGTCHNPAGRRAISSSLTMRFIFLREMRMCTAWRTASW